MQFRRKLWFAALTVSAAALVAQSPPVEVKHLTVPDSTEGRAPVVSALEIVRDLPYNGIDHLKGDVEIKTPVCVSIGPNHEWTCNGFVVLRAEQAVYHEDTGQIEASGDVRVTREPYIHRSAAESK